jgi:hypothetical protein
MAEIRCSLDAEMTGIVSSARVMSDWRHYVRSYPWACMGAAAAIGYLVVPKRIEILRPDAATLAKLAERNQLLVKPNAEPQVHGGLAASLFTMIAQTVARGAMGYLGQQAGKYFTQRQRREGNGWA